MILPNGHSKDYLDDWANGRIKQGLGIGCPITDQHLAFKPSQLNFILGLDNVGKTHWIMWYYLVLSIQHGIKWDIWSGENNPQQIVKKLIEMLGSKHIKDMKPHEIYNYHDQIDMYFNFLSIDKVYTAKDLFKIYEATESKGCLIDPYTGLKRSYGHSDNYEFLNESREFVNRTGKTMYVNLHPRTEGSTRLYPKGHDLEGYPQQPLKSHAEGGQPFANRADDFLILHRLTQHPMFRLKTELHIPKIKDTDTGGMPTLADEPIRFDYNYGLGFLINGFNPLGHRPVEKQFKMPISKEWE